jgi:hypothetical protein
MTISNSKLISNSNLRNCRNLHKGSIGETSHGIAGKELTELVVAQQI